MEHQLKDLYQNYIKIAEVMLNTYYKRPKDACRMATEFHKLFDKYGNRPKLMINELQRRNEMGMYLLYINYLKELRKEYLKIRESVNHPWTLKEESVFNETYFKLMMPECEKILIKYNLTDSKKYMLDKNQGTMVKQVEDSVKQVEKKVEEYLKSNKKFKRYQNLIPVIRPQLYNEIFDLRSELNDRRFQEEINKIKCVDAKKCKSGKPEIHFIANNIPMLVSNQIQEIVEYTICQNRDLQIKKNNYNIGCGNRLSNVHKLVEDILENSSKPLNFDDTLKQVLRIILEPKQTIRFGKLNSIKEFKSIKSYLSRKSSKKQKNSSFGKTRNLEEVIFQRIIDFAILFGVIFFIGKYGNHLVKEVANFWMEGETLRNRQLDEERKRQEREYESRRREQDSVEQLRREEDHQRRMLEFEASQRRFNQFEKRLMGQVSNPSSDYKRDSEFNEVVSNLKYDGPNKMLELFLEPSQYTKQMTRKKGLFKPPTGYNKKHLFRPPSTSANDIPVSEKLIQLLMERFGQIQSENQVIESQVPQPNFKTRPNDYEIRPNDETNSQKKSKPSKYRTAPFSSQDLTAETKKLNPFSKTPDKKKGLINDIENYKEWFRDTFSESYITNLLRTTDKCSQVMSFLVETPTELSKKNVKELYDELSKLVECATLCMANMTKNATRSRRPPGRGSRSPRGAGADAGAGGTR
jgi:hypothetical protein